MAYHKLIPVKGTPRIIMFRQYNHLVCFFYKFIVFFFLIAFLGLVIAANIFLLHSMELWKLIGFSVGGMVVMCAAILYAEYRKWL